MKKGALLLNLGTPDNPRPWAVARYLREFLMDPLVIDLAFPMRWLLVHGAILPTRPFSSAKAYQKVWTKQGSPLLFHTVDLAQKVQGLVGTDLIVRPAMRYQNPSIRKALSELKEEGVNEVTVLPLYPQYSLAATESSIVETNKQAKALDIKVRFIEPFYNHPEYQRALTTISKAHLEERNFDHYLFSFHGLPERQITKIPGCDEVCQFSEECCKEVGLKNKDCYRAQSFETARELARSLDITDYTICFQSRLGRTPWIKPYTDLLLPELPKRGIKTLAVFCPSFVADCLETLEEIAIRAKETFVEAGGEELVLIPSLNSDDVWAESVAKMITESDS